MLQNSLNSVLDFFDYLTWAGLVMFPCQNNTFHKTGKMKIFLKIKKPCEILVDRGEQIFVF